MALRRNKNKRPRQPEAPETCFFCDAGKTPSFKDYETLKNFLSERGKILPKERSGLCSTHQRKLCLAIKRARYLGLLPYTSEV